LSGTKSVNTAVHEIAHQLEVRYNTTIGKKAREFFAVRTQGQKLQKLKDMIPGSAYGEAEVAYEGNFFSKYVGKYYGSHIADGDTEIISMGIEAFFKDPYLFHAQDPEHFELILRILYEATMTP
jgi:hypothetical protein